MVAVLQMNPDMDAAQWMLVTLTAGVGGSMLSIGSAAGVVLMGQARGQYLDTFTHQFLVFRCNAKLNIRRVRGCAGRKGWSEWREAISVLG